MNHEQLNLIHQIIHLTSIDNQNQLDLKPVKKYNLAPRLHCLQLNRFSRPAASDPVGSVQQRFSEESAIKDKIKDKM